MSTGFDPTAIDPNTGRAYGFGPASAVPGAASPPAAPSQTPSPGPATEVLRTAEEREAAQLRAATDAFDTPPARPLDYTFPAPPMGVEPLGGSESLQLKEEYHKAGLPNGLAGQLVFAGYGAQRQSDAELQMGSNRARDALARTIAGQRHVPAEQAQREAIAMMSAVDDFVIAATASSPRLREAWENTDVSNNVALIKTLYAYAQRRAAAGKK